MKKYLKRIGEISLRMSEIADLCEKEKRSMTEDEKTEFESIRIERGILSMRVDAMQAGKPVPIESRADAFDKIVRDSVTNSTQTTIKLERADVLQDLASAENITPVTIGDVIQPLEKGLILNKVGLKLQTGLAGDYVYPIVAAVDAEIAGQEVALSDKKIDITKLQPVPKRVGISIPVSNFAVHQTRGVLLEIVKTQIPQALQRTLNKWMFQPAEVVAGCAGCFNAPGTTVTFADDVPTYKELILMRGKVYAKGVVPDGTEAYVMGAELYAMLEATPIDAGSGLMVIQNGKIGGIPVFVTEYIGAGKIGFGIFSYELFGQFGDMNFIVDPYTGAKKNNTYFVLNTEFSMTSARTEAFALGTTKTVAAEEAAG
ncbi:phage major capsid family protein [Parabacteroides sp.]